MKLLCSLTTITFFSAQAYAGFILPDLSRSKSDANASPIAVGFSNRNSTTLDLTRTSVSGDNNGADYSDGTVREASASLFYSNPRFHAEVVGNLGNSETNYKPTSVADTDTNDYGIHGSFAMPFEALSLGVAVGVAHSDSLASGVKTDFNTTDITVAGGYKFMPNMAVGLGLTHTIDKPKNKVVGGTITEYPSLKTNDFFLGVAYGVDQKIGENGFGVEAVVSHTPKEKEGSLSQGATTSVAVDGNYIMDMVDFKFAALFSKGKDYADVNSKDALVLGVKPEIMISNPFYVTPQVSYAHVKNSADSGVDNKVTTKAWIYGTDVGMRVAKYDVALTYLHGSVDTTSSTISTDTNSIAARFTLYF
jgi:hypothetical protein